MDDGKIRLFYGFRASGHATGWHKKQLRRPAEISAGRLRAEINVLSAKNASQFV